jgi:hypothetical protein
MSMKRFEEELQKEGSFYLAFGYRICDTVPKKNFKAVPVAWACNTSYFGGRD